jgi:hypothetical protein
MINDVQIRRIIEERAPRLELGIKVSGMNPC